MANWCDVQYKFYGDINNLEKFEKCLKTINHEDIIENIWKIMGQQLPSNPIEAASMWGSKWELGETDIDYDVDEKDRIKYIYINGISANYPHIPWCQKVCSFYSIKCECVALEPNSDFFIKVNINTSGKITKTIETNYFSLDSIKEYSIEHFETIFKNISDKLKEKNLLHLHPYLQQPFDFMTIEKNIKNVLHLYNSNLES